MFFRKSNASRPGNRRAKKSADRCRAGFGRRRSIALEPLEDRRLLAVTTTYTGPTALFAALDVNAGSQAFTQGEVGVAVNPTNPLNVVAVANNNSDISQLATYFTTDGGINWTPSFVTSAQDGFGAGESRFDPNVAFDSDGNAYVVYSLSGEGGANNSRLAVARSTNGGSTYTLVTQVTTDATPGGAVLHTAMVTTRPDPAGADDVFVTVARVVAGLEEIEAYLSLDAGASYTVTNGFLNDAAQRTFLPWAYADEFGNFHVVWEVDDGADGSDPEGRLLHDVLNNATLASGADTLVSNLQLTDFANANSKIPAQPNRGLFSVSTIDIDLSGGPFDGRIYVSYSDRLTPTSNDVDIYVRSSDDNGATWSAPIQVNDDSTLTSQFMPRMGVDQTNGDIYVAWYDARNDLVNNRAVNVFAAISSDGGATWSPNVRVSQEESDVAIVGNDGNDYTEYLGLSVRESGAYIAWTDKRASNFAANEEDVFVGYVARTGQIVTVEGDLNGTPTNDAILVQLDASGTFLQTFINGTLVHSQALEAVESLIINGLGGSDTLTVDYNNGFVDVDIIYNGGPPTIAPGDSLRVNGDGNNHGAYTPSSITPGSGVVEVDGRTITFSGLEPVVVNGFFEFTFVTPNSNDVITVDSPAAGQNRVSGTSGNVAFEAITFFDIDHFKIDTASNDAPLANSNDSVTFISDLVATDLDSFTVETGEGFDTVNGSAVGAASLSGITVLAGIGNDTITGTALPDFLDGGDGQDNITGLGATDVLLGGADADTLRAGLGSDIVDGGGDNDILILDGQAGVTETVTVNPDSTNPTRQDVTGQGGTKDVANVELIVYNGVGGDDTLVVTPGPVGQARVQNSPTDQRARITSDTLPAIEWNELATFRLSHAGSTDTRVDTFVLEDLFDATTYEYRGAADALVIEGGPADNNWTVVRSGANISITAATGLGVRALTVLPTFPGEIRFETLGGDDILNVDNTAGLITVPIVFNGGFGSDQLRLIGTMAVTTSEYTPGPSPDAGTVVHTLAAATQFVTFTGLEPVIDVVPAATLIVNGTNADNAINYRVGRNNADTADDTARGRVSVDGFETIDFSNKATLVINGLAGDDTINLNNPNTPLGLIGDADPVTGGIQPIRVNGGDPTASDTLIVNGTTGPDAINFAPNGADSAVITGAGPVVVSADTIEHVTISGEGGADVLTYTSPSAGLLYFTPGATVNSGSVTGRIFSGGGGEMLVPMDYTNIDHSRAFAQLIFANAGGHLDSLAFYGTDASDVFTVNPNGGNGSVLVERAGIPDAVTHLVDTRGINNITLHGLDGDDVFNLNSPLPYAATVIDGGNPSASDVLNFTGSATVANAITVNLLAATVTEATFGPVSFIGTEILNVNANGHPLTIAGTNDDDDVTVTVLTATSGRVEIGYAAQQNGQVDPAILPPVINYSGLAASPGNALAIDLGSVAFPQAGQDTLVVVGNAFAQNWDVNAVAGSVAIDDVPNGVGNDGLVTFTGTESLAVFGLEGNDAFTVTSGAIPVFVDGGDPIGNNLPGDSIIVIGAIVFFPGPEVDEGGFLTLGGTISFDHIESIIVVGGPCPLLVLGTNADDDITVIARNQQIVNGVVFYPGADGVQDFTVAVNAGIEVLVLNQPDLFIDALGGDDDIVIRTPAPNDADWDVNVRVAGGPPSIGETNDGDRLVLETPGVDSIVFNPTGPDTGNIVVDEDGDLAYTAASTDSIITFGPFIFECDDPVGPPIEFTYISSPGGVELIEYDGEDDEADPVGGVVDNPDDAILINGTAGDDTTTVAPQDLGNGTFVSDFSPLFVFRSFQSLTVNPGPGGFDHVIYNATEAADVITSTAATITLADNLIHTVTLGAGIDRLDVNTFGGNDSIDLDLNVAGLQKFVDAGAGNDLVNMAGSVDATILGGDGDDALFGSPASDRIEGGNGNDVMVGGPGDDFVFGGAGSDSLDWNPGDGDDLFEGDDGDDALDFAGANGTDNYFISRDNGRVLFQRTQGNISISMGSVENIFANCETIELSGRKEAPPNTSTSSGFANFIYNAVTGLFDVRVFVTGLTAADILDSHIHMNIPGSNGPVVVPLGGGAGYVPVGGGLERFVPGLSLAAIVPPPGFTAFDVLMEILLGRAYFNVHTPANPGGEIRGNIIVSGPTAGSGGADSLEVRDVTGTSLRFIVFDVGNEAEVRNGAALVDTVTVQGLNVSDEITAGVPNILDNNYLVTGLPYNILVTSSDGLLANGALRDQFVLNGNGGDDNLKALPPVENVTRVTLDGGQGDDFLSADAILIGGPGDDFLEGGAGDDQLFGNAGEDTMIGHGGNDTYDGGADFDTILVLGTSGNDIIQAIQTLANTLVHTVQDQLGTLLDGGTQTDTFINTERVRIEAGAGDDTIRVSVADALNAIANASLLFDIEGGQAHVRDRLAVIDDGVDDLTIYRKGESDETGSFTIGPGNADPFDFVFAGVEFSEVLDELNRPISLVLGNGRLVVFKHDPFEANNDIAVATHLGASETINVDPTIDPGPVTVGPPFDFTLPGDQDWYRVEALHTGTLDFQVFFEEIGILASGRPGLPANGNLDIQVYDVDGTLIAGAGPLFGINDGPGELNVDFDAFAENERIRIPAVQGQVYYLRVFGAPPLVGVSLAINNYNVTVINEPALVPYDIELDDNLGFGDAIAGGTAVNFTSTPRPGTSGLSPINGYYVGKEITFTTGALDGQTSVVTAYTFAAGVGTFTVAPAFSAAPGAGDDFQVDSVDTGRSQFDNVTRDNTPTIFFRLDDDFFLNDLPGNPAVDTPPDEVIPIPFRGGPGQPTAPGYAIAIFDEGPGTVGATPPQTPLGFAFNVGDLNSNGVIDGAEVFVPGVYKFTTPTLTDGSHFLSARVQMIDPSNTDGVPGVGGIQPMTGFGARSLSLEIIVDTVIPPVSFGDPVLIGDGLSPVDDSGVSPPNPELLVDRVTNDTTPTFWGRAEADAIIRLYVDINGNQLYDQNIDRFIGQATAIPLDGSNQEPHGYWEIESIVSFNDPAIFPIDGLRTVFVVAEDLAGNINLPDDLAQERLRIFIDTQGPRITSVFITDVPAYDLFNPKGPDANAQGPTPLVKQLTITFTDLPFRFDLMDPNLPLDFLFPALKAETVITDHFQVIGDQNGRISIVHPLGLVQTLVPVPGMPGFFFATATVTLTFFTPLPDDRFTLIVTDSVLDPAGNRLDGETNAAEPQEDPRFPSGDGVPGGDFVARFTVDSRPELALYAGIRVYADINGNFVFDPEGQDNDAVNRDIVFRFGSTSDALFAGKFVTPPNVPLQVPAPVVANRFFDQFAAYGNILGVFRWLFDFDSNGVADLVTTQPAGFQINGLPVAGNFDGNFANGDEIGLFDGLKWWRDTNHDFIINNLDAPPINGLSAGFPQVGDVDGDALEDFITYQGDTYFVDFANNGLGVGPVTSIPLTLDGGGLGFPGVSERPTVADMNQDGIDDFGVWVPGNLGQTPTEISEWFFLVSQYPLDPNDPLITHVPGQPVPGVQPGTLWSFQVFPLVNGSPRRHFEPVPFGTSLFAVFGDEPAFPIVGNFDPPVDVGSGSGSPGGLDTNNVLVAATGAGAEPRVRVFNRQTGDLVLDILAYDPAFRGGVQVATADVNGDGVVDIITAPGAGGGPHIRVFDGANGALLSEFFAYNAAFTGGVLVAAGDIDGDGQAEIVTGPGAGGGPHVRIFNGAGAVLGEYFAYNPAFGGGVNVAVGDVDGDGTLDVITGAGAGGGPHVRVFSGITTDEILGFFAYNPAFGGGVYVAAGDVDGDGRDDVITGAGAGGGPHVRIFSGEDGAELGGFFAYDAAFGGGVRVASGDFDADGRADILTGPGAGGGPHVKAFDGDTLDHVATFMAFDEGFTGGVFVAAPNLGGGQPLQAATAGGGAALTQSQLDQLVAAVFDISRVRVRVANLPGTILGLVYPDLVLIDSDAAGHGWFVDSTPDTSDDLDVDSMDLLTAVAHELGHVLGLDHDDDPLMDGQLSVGVRRALAVSVVDQIFADL